MHKIIIITSLMVSTLLSANTVMADPGAANGMFTCPTISGSSMQTLRNWGYRITGYGVQVIDGTTDMYAPFFNYYVPTGAKIPASLTSYASSSTSYESTTGVVSCNYTSNAGFDAFSVSYQTTHGDGGVVTAQTATSITIAYTVGLKKSA
jgi:hypothetical protein